MSLSKAELTGSVNPVLTEHARSLRPGQYIADEVFPPLLKLGLESGQLQVWDESNLEVPTTAKRAIGAAAETANEGNPTYATFTTARYARKMLHTTREENVYRAHGMDPDRLKMSKVNKLVDQIKLLRERDLASKLNTTGNYDSSHSTTLTTTWANSGGDPVGDIMTAVAQMTSAGVTPNVCICDYMVFQHLSRHTAITDLWKYTRNGAVTPEGFFEIFGMRPIIGRSIYSSSGTKAACWEDGFILGYVAPNLQPAQGESDMTMGRTIVSKEFTVSEYEAPDRDQDGAIWIEVEMGFVHQWIGVDNATDGDSVCYLIDNAI